MENNITLNKQTTGPPIKEKTLSPASASKQAIRLFFFWFSWTFIIRSEAYRVGNLDNRIVLCYYALQLDSHWFDEMKTSIMCIKH